MSFPRRPSLPIVLATLVIGGCQCGAGPKTVKVLEDYKVVPGQPGVSADDPKVDEILDPPPVTYAINVPRVCDFFTQNTVRKVDILWVVDSSGSMAPHQAQLAANFENFIQTLLGQDPPIDFHIGVISTDTDDPNESGTLHPWANANGTAKFIACDANHVCNTTTDADPASSVVDAFTQMSNVGTRGSQVERGLYASYLALNRPENLDNGSGQGFVRPDAALYVVYVSDEDDSSCSPQTDAPVGAGDACRNDPGCHCSDDASLLYGSTDFYVRFLENFKGYGHGDLVAAAAITGVDQNPVPSQLAAYGDTSPHVGCTGLDPATNQLLVSYYGKRYVEVAQATGGAATSICDSNFSEALSRLGFAVSGLRREFKLSRGPTTQSLEVYEAPRDAATCTVDAECATNPDGFTSCESGHCSKDITTSLQPSDDGAQYIQCDNGVLRNVVEFGANVIPPAQGTVELCYDVDAHFNSVCQ